MNADSTFHIGASHAVCQDYALAWNRSPAEPYTALDLQTHPYIILADGCSSSTDTDTGARLLVRAVEQLLLEGDSTLTRDPVHLHLDAAHRALVWAKMLGLRPEAVDATLLTAHVDGDELIVGCTGDGTIAFQSARGAVEVYSISYPSGYPLYPGYLHQPERLLALKERGRDCKEVKYFRSASAEEPLSLRDTSNSRGLTEVFTVKARDYRYVALFSDGINSFYCAQQTETSKGVGAIAFDEILPGLISFKNTRGAFARRRVKSFLKDCRTRGWRHTDDLAVGAIYLGD